VIEAKLTCVRCGAETRDGSATSCACGALLEVIPTPPALSGAALKELFSERRRARSGPDRSGVWRYRELVAPDVPEGAIVTRGEGNTGLYPSRRLAEWVGLRGDYWVKHEGENPTASFKDRGMCVGVSAALAQGKQLLACASTGNTSSSLASYAALAGVPCVVFVPAGKISTGKMAQTLAYGARVLELEGSFDVAMQMVEEASKAFGLGLVNSVNPWRIEGQKAIGLELLDDLGWDAPDWIVLPSGNLGNISALGKALREAHAAGLIDRLPRIAGVQAAGASPFARYYAAQKGDAAAPFVAEPEPETLATAIRIGNPRSWEKGIREVRTLGGAVLSRTDEEILQAKEQVDAAGIGCEPASAASVAGVRQLVAEGVIDPDARVVSILTGHLLKDPDTTAKYLDGALEGIAPPAASGRQVVPAELGAIRAALADLL
jgi:threonine synthase